MILIDHNGERLLVADLAGYQEATVIAENVDAPPEYVAASDLLDDGTVPLAMLKSAKRDAVKAVRSARETGTCSTPSGDVQIDDTSKIKINGLASMAMIANAQSPAAAFSVGFIMADNSVVTLDANAAIAMSMAVGQFISALYANSTALFAAIDAAANAASLAAIDINAGWP